MSVVTIIGAGPAGAVAALAAQQEGQKVALHERSVFPRHKVCGEFLSPEIARVLDRLRMLDAFESTQPARIRRVVLQVGRARRQSALPEAAYGLSRFRLDDLLCGAALERGAMMSREGPTASLRPVVVAHGRQTLDNDRRGSRLFGFKAHFSGPVDDAVELHFFQGCYIGLNPIEGGLTNVCGLGPEHVLREVGFDIDALVDRFAPLRQRVAPLSRTMRWHHCGPLRFENRFRGPALTDGVYPAGDALSFVDPFTGSGMLSAVLSGELAGLAAARGTPVGVYRDQCRKVLDGPYRVASALRWAVGQPWAERAMGLLPGSLLFRLTRPHGR